MIVVLSCAGREETTAATLHALEVHGGGHFIPPDKKTLFWVGETPPPPALPWRAICFPQKRGGAVRDFWLLLRTFPDEDLVVFEDDVYPSANAVPYMDRWVSEHLTSFFNGRNHPLGPRPGKTFALSQAMKIPARLARALRESDPSMFPQLTDHDLAIAAFLHAWDEKVYQHISIVRHVGKVRANGRRASAPMTPADYVGDEYDSLHGVGQDGAQ